MGEAEGEMEIQQNLDGDILVVSLAGQCDHQEVDNFQAVVSNALAAGNKRILVDLAWLNFLDSTGIKCLVEAHRDAVAQGGQMAVVRPKALVKKVLKLLELENTVPIFETVVEARKLLSGD